MRLIEREVTEDGYEKQISDKIVISDVILKEVRNIRRSA